MAFWWVNHKESCKHEVERGALWSPLRKRNGAHYQAYANMALAVAGDIVISYAHGRVGHVGIVDGEATLSPKPSYATNAAWSNEGWMLPVSFDAVDRPFVPKDHLADVSRLLPDKYSPLSTTGDGTLAYLSAISDEFGAFVLKAVERDHPGAIGIQKSYLVSDLEQVAGTPGQGETTREQLVQARLGQGLFRKRVSALEPSCRVTGTAQLSLLRASHIKPWREASNEERLDGANGLMLAPHIDLLFDRYLLSFGDDGQVILSSKLDSLLVDQWNIRHTASPRPFTDRQQTYLQEHRQRIE